MAGGRPEKTAECGVTGTTKAQSECAGRRGGEKKGAGREEGDGEKGHADQSACDSKGFDNVDGHRGRFDVFYGGSEGGRRDGVE